MKKLNLLLLLVSLLLISGVSYAQPKLTLNVTGGYGVPLGDFKTEVPTTERADADFFPYYTKQLINFGADGKLAFGKKGNARVVFGLTYNMFSNNTDAIFRADSTGTLVTTTFKPKVNIFSVMLGGEWAFMPTQNVNPFIGVGIVGNFFSGEFEFGRSVFVKGAQRTAPMDMKSETRIGFMFDGGVDFHVSPQVGIIAGIKYHMINPLGKGADDPSEVGPNEIDLGDEEHTEDGNFFEPRSISSFNGYLGVSFYLGMPKTTKRR
jgi:opacity protein-like surface antigen